MFWWGLITGLLIGASIAAIIMGFLISGKQEDLARKDLNDWVR